MDCVFCFDVEVREIVGKKLTSLRVAELFKTVWSRHFTDNFLSKETDPLWVNMYCILAVLWNVTDKSTELCRWCLKIGLHKDVLLYLSDSKFDPAEMANLRYQIFILLFGSFWIGVSKPFMIDLRLKQLSDNFPVISAHEKRGFLFEILR
jgi:hypothetical protein